MRLDEITKAEFVGNLTDPSMMELKKKCKLIVDMVNIDGLDYNIKTQDDTEFSGTRRKAIIEFDPRNIEGEFLPNWNGVDRKIGSYFQQNLENWTLKEWEISRDRVMTYYLYEK